MTTVSIKGMSCPHCVASVTKALQAIPGISNIEVNLEKNEATYRGDVSKDVVKEAIAGIGFEVVGYPT
ncbi:copper chaperone [Desulfocapsa sulfexigens DSM 10523]|uniref:Copper chaperone n=1 Tax=Desulfocapsa sulfexigens (strain DSM 10523 / SB164P1) TaxID=1167006 RepID=M1PAZ5_DESSD|nr:heavy metal-associated domain-containing protein [Desulfocapsa sulfexigens]AGF78822.1 copper chaperone [Desulfocapsa sulfexigens DSM 10523]